MSNFKSVVCYLVVDFGGGCRRSCDRGKTKSTPSPFDLDWNGLGLEFDNKAFAARSHHIVGLLFSLDIRCRDC